MLADNNTNDKDNIKTAPQGALDFKSEARRRRRDNQVKTTNVSDSDADAGRAYSCPSAGQGVSSSTGLDDPFMSLTLQCLPTVAAPRCIRCTFMIMHDATILSPATS